jgi:hypothetical protein
MFRDLTNYTRALIRNWWFRGFFILSLISTAATFYASFHPGFLLPRDTLVVIALFALLVSPFGVYKRQEARIQELLAENAELKAPPQNGRARELANLISELEDNLRKALDPITDRFSMGAYTRPSMDCWKSTRNAPWLDKKLRDSLNEVYADVDRWCSIVDSGVKPGMGSPKLNFIVTALKVKIPTLLEALRKAQCACAGSSGLRL